MVQIDNYMLFLVGSAVLVPIDIALLASSRLSGKAKNAAGLIVASSVLGFNVTTYALLLQAFVDNNFQVVSVYSFSSSGNSIFSKIYASWAGAAGSMLFLTLILSFVFFALRIITFKKPDTFSKNTCQIFGFFLLVFIIICLVINPFESYSDLPLQGRGLNPQLQSFWMAIHPPIVFSAYACVVLAYALTLASVRTGKELEASKLFKGSTYAAWLLLTLGIALGGVWAYEVLGWGGYWAWDPVETASLLPWLFLTAYFIVREISHIKKSLTKELMIMLTFASLVFLSALTRGNFKSSVHSYAASAVGPIMLTFSLTMIFYFFYLKKSRRLPLFKLDINKSSLTSRSIAVGFWALILIGIICLLGLAYTNFPYSYWAFPFVLIFAISLIGFSLNKENHYARILLIVIVTLGIGAGASLIGFTGVNFLTTFTTPLLIFAFFSLVYKLFKSIRAKHLRLFGQSLLYVAIIVLLIGVFISAGAKNTATIDSVKTYTQIEALNLNFELSSIRINNSSTKIYNEIGEAIIPEYSTIETDVTIQQSGRTFDGMLVASFYPNYGLVLKPLIITTEAGDIYIHFEYSDSLYDALVETYSGKSTIPDEVSVTVQYSPLIYLVWGGVALMLVGMSVQFASDLKTEDLLRKSNS